MLYQLSYARVGADIVASVVAVHRLRRERRQADRHVLGAVGRAVAHALAGTRVDGLAWADLQTPAVVLDDEATCEHERVLVEVRCLSGFRPPGRTRHPRDADGGFARRGAADELIDPLRQVARRLDHRRPTDELNQRTSSRCRTRTAAPASARRLPPSAAPRRRRRRGGLPSGPTSL